jgi:uncharacterized delta-60 repeat protein
VGRFRLRPEVLGLEDRLLLTTAGALDPSFGAKGVEEAYFDYTQSGVHASSSDQSAYAVAIDSAGNVVTAGYADSADSVVGVSGTVERLTSTGTPDPNFEPGGQFIMNNSSGYQNLQGPVDVFNSIVQDNDTNELTLVGYHRPDGEFNPSVDEFSLVRLISSGGGFRPDQGFGQAKDGGTVPIIGMATVSFSPSSSDQANAAVVQPNGTILVSGSSTASTTEIPLARLNFSNGRLDTTFNPNGAQPGTELLTIPGVSSVDGSLVGGISAMAFQGTADVILAGTATVNGQSDILLIRLKTSDDTIDANPTSPFGNIGNNGVALVPVPAGTTVSSLTIDPNSGRILVAGSNTLAVLGSDGVPDSTFGPSHNGVVTVAGMTVAGVALQPDGKIVVAGSAASSGNKQFASLARYTSGGVPDAAFGSNGLVTTDIGNNGSSAFDSIAIQPDGEIVAAGSAVDPSAPSGSNPTTVIARYIGETADITGLSPPSATQGGPSFTLTVTGDNFVNGSVVLWNGTALNSSFVTDTTLTATVPASDLAQAGTASITVSNSGNINSDAQTFTVLSNKLTPRLVVHGVSATYDGNPHPATFTITGANGDDLTGLVSLTYSGSTTPPVHAGTYTVTATFPGNGSYNPVTDTSQQVIISQAAPTITWANPAAIIAGTPLGAAQLDAAAAVSGTLTYSQPAGTVLGVVSGQVLSVTFTPADTVDYRAVTTQVSIDVLPPPPPHVTGIASSGHSKKGLISITVSFDQSMNSGSAGSQGNYQVFGVVKKKKHRVYTKFVAIRSVTYDDGRHTATITLSKPYKGVVQVTAVSGILGSDGASTGAQFVTTVQ